MMWSMTGSARPDLLVARWVLGQVPSSALVDLAVRALVDGRGGSATAELASRSYGDTESAVESLVRPALDDLEIPVPSRGTALKALVDDCAEHILAGSLAPSDGARRLWLWLDDAHPTSAAADELRPFVGLMSEWSERAAPWAAGHDELEDIEREIVSTARALLGGGGLTAEK